MGKRIFLNRVLRRLQERDWISTGLLKEGRSHFRWGKQMNKGTAISCGDRQLKAT